MSVVPAELVTFCDSIGDVSRPDVCNGYFVEAAGDALLRLQETALPTPARTTRPLAWSSGRTAGGLSYVAGPGGVVNERGRRRWMNPSSAGWLMICGNFWICWSDP
ncbi:hypothetical protein [Streptomyces sp. NPDC055013]